MTHIIILFNCLETNCRNARFYLTNLKLICNNNHAWRFCCVSNSSSFWATNLYVCVRKSLLRRCANIYDAVGFFVPYKNNNRTFVCGCQSEMIPNMMVSDNMDIILLIRLFFVYLSALYYIYFAFP